MKILIYVIFHATLHECLSVSNVSNCQAEKFLKHFVSHHPTLITQRLFVAAVTDISDLYRGRYFVVYTRGSVKMVY